MILFLYFLPLLNINDNLLFAEGFNYEDFENRLDNYEKWLDDTGLFQLYSIRSASFTLNKQEDKYSFYANDVGLKTKRVKNGYNLDKIRLYLYHYNNNQSEQFETEFAELNNIGLNDKLFYKFVHLFNIPYKKAIIHISEYNIAERETGPCFYRCNAGDNGVVSCSGRCLESAMRKAEIQLKEIKKISGMRTDDYPREVSISSFKIRKFIENYFFKRKGKIQVISIEDDAIEFCVSNIKNEIIANKNYWEKIEVSIFLTRKNTMLKIRCYIDAQYGAGLNKPPSNYSDMEPKYSEQLDNYTGELLVKIRDYIVVGNGKRRKNR
ncbi:MAG: hypothetical protein GY795_24460 [Desulfobacterales bacterium]|nr:hypothetical protein [Desulfobacterales bacterium]